MLNVFIYGSLKKGQSNHYVIKNKLKFICKIKSKEKYALIDLGEYPGLIKIPKYQIEGELYQISPDQIKMLDDFEREGELYERETILLSNNTSALTYFYKINLAANPQIITMNDPVWKKSDK